MKKKIVVYEPWDGGSEYLFDTRKEAYAFAKNLVKDTRWTRHELEKRTKEGQNYIAVDIFLLDDDGNLVDILENLKSFEITEKTLFRLY